MKRLGLQLIVLVVAGELLGLAWLLRQDPDSHWLLLIPGLSLASGWLLRR